MTVKRVLLIVNPHGGKRRGLSILEKVKPIFAEANVEIDTRVTKQSGHAREIAREFDPAGYDGLCLIGGDGTIHEAVNGLMERDEPPLIPLGIIPSGTGNAVAKHLGFKGSRDGARRVVAGQTRLFDLIRVEANGRVDYCANVVGWACAADINCKANRLRALGPPRYAIAAIWYILFPRRYSAKLLLDDRSIEGDFMLVAACNTAFTGAGMRLAPRAKENNGTMDVVLARKISRWRLLQLLLKVFDGSHVEMPCVEYHQARSLDILSDMREPLNLDGEISGATPVSLRVVPEALRFFV